MRREFTPRTSGIIIMTRTQRQLDLFKRLMRYMPFHRRKIVCSIEDVQVAMMERKPKIVVLDVSDFSGREYKHALEPVILALPGWIRTYFIDTNSTPERLKSAVNMGVNGVLTQAVSRHALLTLIKEASEETKSAELTQAAIRELTTPASHSKDPASDSGAYTSQE